MKLTVFSVAQPFAGQIVYGRKWCENRSYNTRHRGDVFVFSSRRMQMPDSTPGPEHHLWQPYGPDVTGAIIGCVEIAATATQEDMDECYRFIHQKSQRQLTARQQAILPLLPARDSDLWGHYEGMVYAWILRNPRPLANPIPANGKVRVWTLDVSASAVVFMDGPGVRPS